MRQAKVVGDSLSVAVLVALHIADELHRLRREYAHLTSKIEALSRDLSGILEEFNRAHIEV